MKQSVYLLLMAFFVVACNNSTSDELAVFDFGKGKYKQPFVGWLKSEPEILVKSLKYPPYKWFAPDTLVLGAEFNIDFNDESVRSKSSATLRFADTLAHPVSGVEFFCNEQPIRDGGIAVEASDNDRQHVKIKCKVQPKVGERRVVGYLIADGNELDEINEIPLQHEQNVVAKWSLEQKYGWPIMLWLLWALTVVLILVALYFLIKGLVLLFIAVGKYLAAIKIPSIALPKLGKKAANHRGTGHDNGPENPNPCYLCAMERHLYSNMSVADKYYILEKIRLELDKLYENDRKTYDKCQKELKENTWKALEEAWSFRYPKSNVSWGGANNKTCSLNLSHKYYSECSDKGFVRCVYDEHGSPDFGEVTFPGSVVDISDLYDSLSIYQIQKRGGSENSLQGIAQRRMAENLEQTVRAWAKKRNVAYDPKNNNSFYAWRDELNLVPHEDPDCRKMRLVYRPAHEAFVHRGGVSNAVNIKKHFEK